MTVTTSIILGLLQALGEFLPISSSAHLALFPFLAKGEYQGLTYDVALHFATLVAVVFYFRKDLVNMTICGFSKPKTQDGKLFWFIGIATIPAALAGYFFESAAETTFRSPLMIALMLMVFALFLWIADRASNKIKKVDTITLLPVLLIGCAQALAIMPGVSRSGITMTAALLLGFTRPQSARVSFLLSIPIIAGAAVLKLKDVNLADINSAFIAGFLAAMIGGWLVIKFIMKYLQTHSFDLFVYYRLILGAIIIALYFF